MMKVHYDNIVFSLQKAGGISTYWAELIVRLLRDDIDLSFDEFKNENIVRNELIIKDAAIQHNPAKYLLLHRFKSLHLPLQTDPFVFHSSYNRITHNPYAAQVTTVHDFVHEKFYKGLRRSLHLLQKKRVLNAAKKIITVSENTKRDLLHFHPHLKEEQIQVIYNGVSTDFFPIPDQERAAAQAHTNKPYLLYIGSREHYKNFDFVVRLLAQVLDFNLYIVGSTLTKPEYNLLNRTIPGRWKHFNHIDNRSLNTLYNMAFALIYPSSYEGFGIPLLEAMNAGTPFLALHNSSIPEVAGDAGVLLPGLDTDLFKQALYTIAQERSQLVAKGFQQAAKFSWEKSYQQTLAIYKELS